MAKRTIKQRMRTAITVLGTCLLLAACAATPEHAAKDTLLLDYEDFGPQAMAHELLGMQWWQWENSGSPNPNDRYAIKVVAYKDLTRAEVERRFPVVLDKLQDYRYVPYEEAMRYLDRHIADDVIADVTARLTRTREALLATLGGSTQK